MDHLAFALTQKEAESHAEEARPQAGYCGEAAVFHLWKKKYGGIRPAELRRLRQLEEKNRQLKQWVSELRTEKMVLIRVVGPKADRTSQQDCASDDS